MLITIGLPIIAENKHVLPAKWLKRRQDEEFFRKQDEEFFLGEELNKFQEISGKKVAKKVKISFVSSY